MWTKANRGTYNRDCLRYPSDLTDAEWGLVEPLIPLPSAAVTPYVWQDGTFNANNKLKDVDVVALGAHTDIYPVDLTKWLSSKMSIRGEYLTDTENEKEAFASEFTFSPVATQESKWIIPLNERIDASVLGGEGASFQIGLTGRLRYGPPRW